MSPEIITNIKNIARNLARRTGVDIDDLSQEGLIAAWKSEETWDGAGTLETRSGRCARLAMIDYIRKTVWDSRRSEQKPVFVEIPTAEEKKDYGKLAVLSPVEHAIYIKEVVTSVKKLRLPKRMAEAFLATTIGDVHPVVYAKAIGVSASRVEQLISHAKNLIKTRLK